MKIGSVGGTDSSYVQDYGVKRSESSSGSGSPDVAVGETGGSETTSQVVTQTSSSSGADSKKSDENKDAPNEDILKKAVEQANKNLAIHDKFIEREVHKVTHTVMYKLKDSSTGEVIAEYPPKKLQDMIAKMWEMAGLVVDKKA